MMMHIDEVIGLLKEELHKKETLALQIRENVNEQFANLGRAAGVKEVLIKFENIARRESN